MFGVNLSGAEFGRVPGRYGYDYIYPSKTDIQYYADLGVDVVRLPVRWERLQPTAGGALDPAELGRLKTFIGNADSLGVKVIVDLHNFGGYFGQKLGSTAVPVTQFTDFWTKLATAIGGEHGLAGYDLMNEPVGLPSLTVWPQAAQAATDAIRTVDTLHTVYVEGMHWANLSWWSRNNASLDVHDSANNLVYEAHAYFDRDRSGTYKYGYDQEGASPHLGEAMLTDFVNWLDAHHARGMIGEFAVPDTDPRWLTVLDNFMTAVDSAGLDATYWGAGPWWGSYPLALRNRDGTASTQLPVFASHLHPESGQGAAGHGDFGVLHGGALVADDGLALAGLDHAAPLHGLGGLHAALAIV